MDSSRQNKFKPADLVVFVDSEFTAGPTTVFHIDLLGNEASGIFGQANEALYRKDKGWEEVFERAAVKFEKIAGFRPEEVYQAEAKLRESKGLEQPVDRQRRLLLEGLKTSAKLRTKEG